MWCFHTSVRKNNVRKQGDIQRSDQVMTIPLWESHGFAANWLKIDDRAQPGAARWFCI